MASTTTDQPAVAGLLPREWTNRRLLLDIGVWVAAIPLLAAAARILLYSGGDQTLLRVLIQTLDVVTVLLGTLLPMLPLLVGAALLPVIVDVAFARHLLTDGSKTRRRLVTITLIVALTFWITLSPWAGVRGTFTSAAIGIFVGIVIAYVFPFYFALSRGRTVRESVASASKTRLIPRIPADLGQNRQMILAPTIAVIVLFAFPSGMWLPRENVSTPAGETTGYVLSSTEVWTTILDVDKRVVIVKSEDVISREVCGQGSHESLATMAFGPYTSKNPQCGE